MCSIPTAMISPGLFGEWGQKAQIPSIWEGFREGLLPDFRLLGMGRHPLDLDREARPRFAAAVNHAFGSVSEQGLDALLKHVYYYSADVSKDEDWDGWERDGHLNRGLTRFIQDILFSGMEQVLIMSLLPPEQTIVLVKKLAQKNLLRLRPILMCEKPFSDSAESARAHLRDFYKFIPPENVLPVDHYLSQYGVLNAIQMIVNTPWYLGGMRPEFLRRLGVISYERDTVSQSRVETYESFRRGVIDDMILTHCAQVLIRLITAIALALRGNETTAQDFEQGLSQSDHEQAQLELLEHACIDPNECVFGQVEGYEELGGRALTPTFFHGPMRFSSGPFADKEIILASGKGLDAKYKAIRFDAGVGEKPSTPLDFILYQEKGNQVLKAQVLQTWHYRRPGLTSAVNQTRRIFDTHEQGGELFLPYTKMIHSAINGDWMNFPHNEVVIRLWEIFEPVLSAFEGATPPRIVKYPQGVTPEKVIELYRAGAA